MFPIVLNFRFIIVSRLQIKQMIKNNRDTRMNLKFNTMFNTSRSGLIDLRTECFPQLDQELTSPRMNLTDVQTLL